MKAKWGKYKATEVDAYIAQLTKELETLKSEYHQKVIELSEENQRLKQAISELESKENLIAKVMLDATMRAKDIEQDYKKRAQDSDIAYENLRDEWAGHFRNSKDNIEKIRSEAANLLSQINMQFDQLSAWSDQRLSELTAGALPALDTASASQPAYEATPEKPPEEPIGINLEQEIAKGSMADLKELCEELGLINEQN